MFDDFLSDFRHHNFLDNDEWPPNRTCGVVEMSECNKERLRESFLKVKDHAKAILEIGVCKNAENSSAYIFFDAKNTETIYIGVDLLDKMNVTFKLGEHIAHKPLIDFKKMVKDKAVTENTIVFNNLINTIEEFNDSWEVPALDSWHSRFF